MLFKSLQKQDDKHLILNRIVLILIVMGIFIFFGILWLLSILVWDYFLPITLILLVYFFIKFFYFGALFRSFSYMMNEDGLYVNRGVFWRKKIVVSRNRVQHIDVIQGPLERKYGLATLIVHTAGTRNSSVKVYGVLYEKAEQMRDSLLFKEGNDGV